MLKKQQIEGLALPLIAFLAKTAPANGEETASFQTRAMTYKDDGNTAVIANEGLPAAISPFTGKRMRELAGATSIEISAEDLEAGKGMAVACTCSNPKCGVDIYVPQEITAKLAGEEFHCIVCATVNTIQGEVASEGDTPAGDVAEGDKPAGDAAAAEAAAEGDADKPVEGESAEAGAEEGTEPAPDAAEAASADGEEITEEEIDEVIEKAAEEDEEDDDDDDDDDDDEEVDADGNVIVSEEEVEEDAAAIDTVDSTVAAAEEEEPSTSVTVSVSALIDFSPETASLVGLTPDCSRVALVVFDNNTRETVVASYLDRAAAHEDLRGLFAPDRLKTLRDAVIACGLEDQPDFSRLGLREITAEVEVPDVAVAQAREQLAASADEAVASLDKFEGDFKSSMEIAMLGMNRGTYANPLLEELAGALESIGVQSAGVMAARILERSGDAFTLALMEKTSELLALSEETRDKIGETIEKSAKSLVAAAIELEDEVQPAKRATEVPVTAAFHVPPIVVEGETASTKPNAMQLLAGIGIRSF